MVAEFGERIAFLVGIPDAGNQNLFVVHATKAPKPIALSNFATESQRSEANLSRGHRRVFEWIADDEIASPARVG